MKLAKLQIENFRHLGSRQQPFALDFTDALGRVRDFTLLVGPNTSGKTTILDAVAAATAPVIGLTPLRPDFKLSPRTVVRRGELHAQVTCWLRFSAAEIAAIRELFRLAEIREDVPEAPEVKLVWTYPAPPKQLGFQGTGAVASISSRAVTIPGATVTIPAPLYWSNNLSLTTEVQPGTDFGLIQCEPKRGWLLLAARFQVAHLLATGRADCRWLHRLGGVFTFDQERTGLGKTISRQVWNIIHGTTEAANENEELRTTDPRSILIDLALQSLVPPAAAKEQAPQEFHVIQEAYARICAPRRIAGAVRDDLGEFDIAFTDGANSYTYDGLSSGEKNVLLLLIRFAAERMHQSIVLIDELELNQHPLWQGKLVHLVPRMGEGNQIIATTHSPYLRGAVAPEAVIDLGDLGEVHAAAGS